MKDSIAQFVFLSFLIAIAGLVGASIGKLHEIDSQRDVVVSKPLKRDAKGRFTR